MVGKSFQHARGALCLEGRPAIFGILNVTPDSFSDGGHFEDPTRAIDRGLAMILEGADVIDVGGESTRPGAPDIAPDVEIQRVVPVIAALARRGAVVSIDTRKAAVANAALDAGAAIVNDVSGLRFDGAMAQLIAERKAGVVIMHSRGTPATMRNEARYTSLVDDVIDELRVATLRARASGIQPTSIAIDPGIGFAKTAEQSLEILGRLEQLLVLGYPLFVGPSRKSFIGHVTNRPVDARVFGTAAAIAIAVAKGASMIRVHDVAAMREVVLVGHAIAAATAGAKTEDTAP